MLISISSLKFKEKPNDNEVGLVNNSLCNEDVTIEQLACLIGQGCSFCPALFKNDDRCIGNFIKSSVVALDIDKSDIPMEETIEAFSCSIAYPTFSNGTIMNKYSYRLVYRLDEDIFSLEEYYKYATILSEMLKDKLNVIVDKTCLNGVQMCYGTNNSVTIKCSDSDYDYSKQFLTSWWNESNKPIIQYTTITQECECNNQRGDIYHLFCQGVPDTEIISVGNELGYKFLSSSKQMIDWNEGEEVRIESNHIEIKRQWTIDENNKRHPRKWRVGEDRRIRFLKVLSIKKQINPAITYDELLYNAICERHYFFFNYDDKLNNRWIRSILPSVLRTSYLFETEYRFSCNTVLLKEKGKSYQKAIAEKKHNLLAEAIIPLFNESLTIKQNLEIMQANGIKISLRTLNRILEEKGMTKKRAKK